MRNVSSKEVSLHNKGSISIEALIVIPLFLVIIYLMILGPLSNVYFNHFEKNLTRELIDSINHTVTVKDIEKYLERSDNLTIRQINFENDRLEVIIRYKKLISRRWRIYYPMNKIGIKKLVYITDTGKKYHLFGCKYLRESMIPIFYSLAVLQYDNCKVCTLKSSF